LTFCDTSQSAGRGGRSDDEYIPTILPRSTMIIVEKQRRLLGYEALAVHGFPMSEMDELGLT
jgi:hypothetical protein